MAVAWQPGSDIGPYRLERLLGAGGVGQVWVAADMRLARPVAIKVISEQFATGATVDRLAREARSMAHLRHPSIVQVYEFGREGEFHYIVSEFVDGLDLATLISRGTIRIGWGIYVARQIVQALIYAHSRGIIHRDIKPSNILIDGRSDRAQLTDFGLARGVESYAFITRPGVISGTPAYMAPEQFRGEDNLDPRADVYSLGATLYHLFTGKTAHKTTDLIDFVKRIESELPVKPQELRSDIPKTLSDSIIRMLEPKSSKRIISLTKFEELLRTLETKFPYPTGKTLEQRAIEVAGAFPQPPALTMIAGESTPTGFFDTSVFKKSQFFGDESIRFSKIQESLKFYRDHLNNEYQSLLRQANMTYRLWLGCVGLGFLVLLSGVVAMLFGRITEGVVTAASSGIVYFIQRLFQQREDYYRSLATAKNSHLEYGNHWLLVIQSIDSIENPTERAKRQSRLVAVLTDKLSPSNKALNQPEGPVKGASASD